MLRNHNSAPCLCVSLSTDARVANLLRSKMEIVLFIAAAISRPQLSRPDYQQTCNPFPVLMTSHIYQPVRRRGLTACCNCDSITLQHSHRLVSSALTPSGVFSTHTLVSSALTLWCLQHPHSGVFNTLWCLQHSHSGVFSTHTVWCLQHSHHLVSSALTLWCLQHPHSGVFSTHTVWCLQHSHRLVPYDVTHLPAGETSWVDGLLQLWLDHPWCLQHTLVSSALTLWCLQPTRVSSRTLGFLHVSPRTLGFLDVSPRTLGFFTHTQEKAMKHCHSKWFHILSSYLPSPPPPHTHAHVRTE